MNNLGQGLYEAELAKLEAQVVEAKATLQSPLLAMYWFSVALTKFLSDR